MKTTENHFDTDEQISAAMGDAEAFDHDIKRLLRAVNEVLRHGMEANRRERLVDAAADVEAWFETNDPRDMGWVDDRGRP